MKRKNIELKLKDYRKSFNEPHMKKPYYLYVEWGNRNFCFSNKRKAERWLKKFEKEVTQLYRELNIMLFDLFKINCVISDLLDSKKAKDFREDIIWYANKFNKVSIGICYTDFEVGTELRSILNTLMRHLAYYRAKLRKNNRFRYLYEDIRFKIKQARRLKSEFDLLLSGAEGINEITSDKLEALTYERKITVVA